MGGRVGAGRGGGCSLRRPGRGRGGCAGRGRSRGLGGPLARLAAPPAVAVLQNGVKRCIVDQGMAGLGGRNGGLIAGGRRRGGRRETLPARGPCPPGRRGMRALQGPPRLRQSGGRRSFMRRRLPRCTRRTGINDGRLGRGSRGRPGPGPRRGPTRTGPRPEHAAYAAVLLAQGRLLAGQPRGHPVKVRPVRVVQRPAGLDHAAYVQQPRRLAYPRLGHLAHVVGAVLGGHARRAERFDILLPRRPGRRAGGLASAPVLAEVAEQDVVGKLVDAGVAPLGEAVELCRVVPS